jgi:hypothetical protein
MVPGNVNASFSEWELVVKQISPTWFGVGEWAANQPGKYSEMDQFDEFRFTIRVTRLGEFLPIG